MKKSFLLVILSTPLIILVIIDIMRVNPEVVPIEQSPVSEITHVKPTSASPIKVTQAASTFMTGYWDGRHGKRLGPIYWTLSDDYRQGHMLGSYDRKNRINRYK